MHSVLISLLLLGSLLLVVGVGRVIRSRLPEDHLSADSRDAVKLSMSLVATMTALLLGMLVSSAKGTYDAQRTQVILLSSKVAFLGRVLHAYGPAAAEARAGVHNATIDALQHMWPEQVGVRADLTATAREGDTVYAEIQALVPQDDSQRGLKAQAATLATELGQLRMLLLANGVPSIPTPLLLMVSGWLIILFVCFSLLAPPNATTALALVAAALSVAGAVFLLLELDQPFGGIIRISSQPMQHALEQLSH